VPTVAGALEEALEFPTHGATTGDGTTMLTQGLIEEAILDLLEDGPA